MGYYNYKVTGSALEMPYSVYDRQYALHSRFLWSKSLLRTPQFHHTILRDFWVGFDAKLVQFQQQHIHQTHLQNLINFYHVFLNVPLLLCILISFPSLVKNRGLLVPLAIMLLFFFSVYRSKSIHSLITLHPG